MNFFNFILKKQGFDIDLAKAELNKIQKECRTDKDSYLERKRWEILNHHISNNEAYKNFLGDTAYTEWSDIPILKKTDIQKPIEERLSKGFTTKEVHLHNTSGSSGTPFYFAKDKWSHALTWAVIQNRFGWHGIEIGRDLQARFYGTTLSKLKMLKEKLKDIFANRKRFPVFDLSDTQIGIYISKMQKDKFTHVNGYTSSLVLVAKYAIKNNFTIVEKCPTLKYVFTTSELCNDIDRACIEKGFGIKVVNEYGAAELDLIGFEDQDGDFILNHETIHVEILDDENQPLPAGKMGRVIVTSLYNKAMPFIRYELGDLAILSQRTKNEYQIIEELIGRTNDIAYLPSGKKSPGLTFYYISKALLEKGGFMREFIIRQKKLDHFHFEYVADREVNNEEIKAVNEAMRQYLEPGITATFERKEVIERTKAGKLKQFFSELDEIPKP